MPVNPSLPPSHPRKVMLNTIRTAAYRSQKWLGMVACGGALGGAVAATSGSLAMATAAALTFLFGAYVQKLAGGK